MTMMNRRGHSLALGITLVALASCGAGIDSGEGSTGSEPVSPDTEPPTAGVVRDGLGSDADTQTSLDSVSANWSGFQDDSGVIDEYEWAIGTTSGAQDVQVWTSVGSQTLAIATGLSLSSGTHYYVAVRASDSSGNVSAPCSSDGILALVVTNVDSPMGTNLGMVSYWATQLPFVDIFKTSMPWVSGDASSWNNGQPLDLDENLNVRSLAPGQIARTLMFQGSGQFPSGRYVLLYDGEGSFYCGGGATRNTALSQPGRDVIDVDSAQGAIAINITATDSFNYLRNFLLVLDSNESLLGQTNWDPRFLARVGSSSALRFMDWAQTNNSTLSAWADRPRVTDCRWSGEYGVPYEVMFDLANTLQADPWICIPHLAADDFVENLADLARDLVDPALKVHIEYSNEVWNSLFEQGQYCQAQGIALALDPSSFAARLKFQSRRSVQIFSMFESSFGGVSRLTRVLAAQSANTWVGEQLMDFENAHQHTDALAIAPYFGPSVTSSNYAQVMAMDVDQLLDHVENVTIPGVGASMQDCANSANVRGLRCIAYEGGQHLVGVGSLVNDQALSDLLIAANRHPRMRDLYLDYLALWRASGGELFVHFSDCTPYGIYGSWGAIEYRDQETSTAPKFRAIQSFIVSNPRWW
jgi:hypothetical protein